MVSLSSKVLKPLQIGVLARWTIRPRLLAVPGVANVAIWGQRERQLQVQVDPARLQQRSVKLEQVISSTGNALWVSPLTFLEASTPGTGGFIDTPQQRLGIQHNLPIITPADLAQIPIDDTAEAPVKLGDVATVVEAHQPLIGDAIVDGADTGAGFMLAVEKLPNANTSEVTKGVDKALRELAPGLKGLTMDSSTFRPASYVDTSVQNLSRSVVLGGALLLVVLALLLFNWRAALTALVSVGLSVVAAALVLRLLGTTFTTLVFAGLVMALAAVEADAVVGVDHVVRSLRERAHPTSGDGILVVAVVRTSALETARSAAWATAIFAMATVPIFLMNGLSGDSFFPPVAGAGLLALGASCLVATTVTPALGLLLLANKPPVRESPLLQELRRGYDRALSSSMRRPLTALALAAAVVVAAAVIVPRSDKALLPPLRDPNLLVHWEAPLGTSLPEMDRITARAAQELRAVPGVRRVGAQVGRALLGDQAVGTDSAEMWVRMAPSADYDTTVAAVSRVLAGYPGLRHQVVTYAKDRMSHELAQTRSELTVRVFGNDLDVLQRKADEVRNLVAATNGVRGARTATRAAAPTMQVEVDIAKARQFGLKPGDVRRGAATLLSGLQVGNLFQDQKVFDVVVWSTPDTRHSLSSVQNLLIDTPSGARVHVGDVANVTVKPAVPRIEHQDVSRFVDITANVSGRNVGAVAGDVTHRLGALTFPLEYHAEVLGDYAKQHHAQQRLAEYAVAAVIGMFLLMQAAFASWRVALIAFSAAATAAGGAAIVGWLDGGPVTLATVAGLLAVVAYAVRTDLVLLLRLRHLQTDGHVFGPDLVRRGAAERLPSTVTAALATTAILLPALAFGDVAGQEILRPLAVVMVGGVLVSTLVSLFVVPALYLRFGPRGAPETLHLESEVDEARRLLVEAPLGELSGQEGASA
jgi:Cu/Ag efflux pump CusA